MKKIKFFALAIIASFALVACNSAESYVKDMEAAAEKGDVVAFEKAAADAEKAANGDENYFNKEQQERILNASIKLSASAMQDIMQGAADVMDAMEDFE